MLIYDRWPMDSGSHHTLVIHHVGSTYVNNTCRELFVGDQRFSPSSLRDDSDTIGCQIHSRKLNYWSYFN